MNGFFQVLGSIFSILFSLVFIYVWVTCMIAIIKDNVHFRDNNPGRDDIGGQ